MSALKTEDRRVEWGEVPLNTLRLSDLGELLPRCRARIPALGVSASKRRYRPSPVACACSVHCARVAPCGKTQNQQNRGNTAQKNQKH